MVYKNLKIDIEDTNDFLEQLGDKSEDIQLMAIEVLKARNEPMQFKDKYSNAQIDSVISRAMPSNQTIREQVLMMT
jgi:hypothetical protein